ncbi:MAG: efflux RND transporter periplasmic adaptor subunit [Myxococcota bacterium]|nr:efflux RND transporter periplasmic adaptor subunit [Myxococcota bacterium]
MSSHVRIPLGWSLLFSGLLACGTGGEAADVPTALVERGRVERIVVATGTIEPEREVEVRPRIAGIIEKIHVDDGDRVEPDQPLVEIERELLASQVREAEASLEAARVELRFAKIGLERSLELERGGAASQQNRDDARSRQQGARAEVARAQARLDSLKTQLSYATVRSSLAGRVLQVHTEEGNAVSPVTAVTGGTLLLSLAGTETLHLQGLVDENEVARVAVGQRARVRTEAFPERFFEGSVRSIAPMGERIQNVTYFEVKIEIVDPEAALLLPRMSGDADIVIETVEDALVVPETALRYRGTELYVAIDGPEAEERSVAIGIVDGSRVQVLSGLAAGETVRLK